MQQETLLTYRTPFGNLIKLLHFEIMPLPDQHWPLCWVLYLQCDEVYSFSEDHLDHHMRMPVTCYLMYKFTHSQQLLVSAGGVKFQWCNCPPLFNAKDTSSPGVSNTEIIFSTKCRYLVIWGSSFTKTSNNTGSDSQSLALTDVGNFEKARRLLCNSEHVYTSYKPHPRPY